jgi:hypothetical protein
METNLLHHQPASFDTRPGFAVALLKDEVCG